MKRRIKPFTLFLWVFVVAYLILGTKVFLIDSEGNKNIKDRDQDQNWKGIITLWDIPYVDVGTGSNSSWLNARIQEFEIEHPGIFIDVRKMTPQRAEMYFAGDIDIGILPDIISIPSYKEIVPISHYENLLNFVDEMELERITPLARKSVLEIDFMKGVPYMMGTYGLFLNKERFENGEINLENGQISYRTLYEALEKLTYVEKDKKNEVSYYGFGSYNSIYSRPIISMIYNGSGKIQEDPGYRFIHRWFQKPNMVPEGMLDMDSAAGTRLFADQGRIGVFLGNTSTLYRLRALESLGKGFQFGVYPIPKEGKEGLFQDQIGALGIINKDDKRKIAYCIAFLKHLLSEESQYDLKRIGMFPVVNDIGYIYEDDLEMLQLEEGIADFKFGPKDDFWLANENEYMSIFEIEQDKQDDNNRVQK